MWSLALLVLAEVACVALGVAHARRVRRVFGDDLGGLVTELLRLPHPERSARARARAPGPDSAAHLLADAADEPTPALRAAEVDGVLGDIARHLDAASGWTTSALRGAIVLGALHAFWVQGTVGAIGLVTGLVVGGILGAMLRKVRRTEQEGRVAIDALVNALVGHRATTRESRRGDGPLMRGRAALLT